jgi:hypothetical protein
VISYTGIPVYSEVVVAQIFEGKIQNFLLLQTSFDLQNIKIPRNVEMIKCLSVKLLKRLN